MDIITLATITEDIREAITIYERNRAESESNARRCGRPMCKECGRLGFTKKTFTQTKLMLSEMLADLTKDSSPRRIFGRHTRKEYGNYQAWILPDGLYVNIWGIGHGAFVRHCKMSLSQELSMVKVHSQGRCSNIIIYDYKNPPTDNQITTIRDIIADAIMWEHKLSFFFSYDAHHPDPRFRDEIPF